MLPRGQLRFLRARIAAGTGPGMWFRHDHPPLPRIDVNGNESVNFCQQVITITEKHNFEIKFPADAEAVCGAADPDSVIYEEIGCDLFTVNHTDEFFSASGDECYKIFRKWKVINWCQYDGQDDQPLVSRVRDEDCDGSQATSAYGYCTARVGLHVHRPR